MTNAGEDAAESREDTTPEAELAALLAAAEPTAPRRLGELIERLEASGRFRTVRPVKPDLSARAGRAAAEGSAVAPKGIGSLPIRGLTFDSRHVSASSIFVAVAGAHSDGHDFVAAAAAQGAAAAIVERAIDGVALPQIVVDDTRLSLATAAAWWYGDPSREMGVIGITGTDGKTTTSFLATAVLEAAGISVGLTTTAGLKIGPIRTANAEHVTTPEAPELQKTLRAMAEAGNEAAIVETTSHGLALHRVDEVAYDIGIFTNLTHEHLELHGTFEAYRSAKLSLFERLGAETGRKRLGRDWPCVAIINAQDPAAPLFMVAAQDAGADVITYGETAIADVRATEIEEGPLGLRLRVATSRWTAQVQLQLFGRFNALNALAAIALGEALDLDPAAIRAGIEGLSGVPGRMERVDCGQPFGVVVDYAHSPASLQKVLETLEPVARAGGGGLIAVFGSAGERDVQKRPMMGRVAAERCRLVVVADEDPRGEESGKILDEIAAGAREAGAREGETILRIADRASAIAAAFERARPGDVVLLAGKGHEQTIIMADGPMPWNERSEAVRALRNLGFRATEPSTPSQGRQ